MIACLKKYKIIIIIIVESNSVLITLEGFVYFSKLYAY